MRLGDLDALSAFVGDLRSTLHKEQSTFKAMTQSEFEIKDSMLLSFQYAIDNAPIVDLKDIYQEGHYDGHLEGYTKAINEERPQGEWKLVSNINNDIDVVCPFCSKTRIFSYAHGYSIEEVKSQLQEVNDLPNYCENCGVEMKGGAE